MELDEQDSNEFEQGLLSQLPYTTSLDMLWSGAGQGLPSTESAFLGSVEGMGECSSQELPPSVTSLGPSPSVVQSRLPARHVPRTTHALGRPVETTVVSTCTGVRSSSFVRSRWPAPFPFPTPYAMPSCWPGMVPQSNQPTPLDTSLTEEIKKLTTSLSTFQATVKTEFKKVSDRLKLVEDRSVSVGGTLEVSAPISSPTPREETDDDLFSLAPRSQEKIFSEEDEEGDGSPVRSRHCVSNSAIAPPSVDESVGGEDEDPSPPLTDREQLRSRVYAIRRELSEIPMSSPPRQVLAPSDFMSCSGLVKDRPKGYKSFPESGHTKSALAFVNESIDNFHSSKGSGGTKFNGFGPSTFPVSKVRIKDFDIHDSSIGKGYPSCDRSYSSLLGTKPVEGLNLSQSLWSKSESNIRLSSSILGTAEHFLAAAGALLKDKGDEFDELKSFLLQVDKSLGSAQLLLMGTLANFSMSKRQEMLDKTSLSEPLKESLLLSPLVKDKLFGFPINKLQDEINKGPQNVKVNVHVSGGQRNVTTSSSSSLPSSSGAKKGSFNSAGQKRRSGGSKQTASSGKKAKLEKKSSK